MNRCLALSLSLSLHYLPVFFSFFFLLAPTSRRRPVGDREQRAPVLVGDGGPTQSPPRPLLFLIIYFGEK